MSKELKTIFGVNSISWVLLVFPILCLLLAFIAGLQVEKHKHRKELQEVSSSWANALRVCDKTALDNQKDAAVLGALYARIQKTHLTNNQFTYMWVGNGLSKESFGTLMSEFHLQDSIINNLWDEASLKYKTDNLGRTTE